MRPDSLGANLLQATGEEFESLLLQAASVPECLVWLLNHAQQALRTSPDSAIQAANVSFRLARLQSNLRSAAIALRTTAQAQRALGKHTEALTSLDEAVSVAREIPDILFEFQLQIPSIDSLAWLGRHTEAVSLSRRLTDGLQSLNALQDAARVHFNLGNVYYRQDRYLDALACYEQAAETLALSGDPIAEANVNFSRANIYSELLRSDEALDLFTSARASYADSEHMTHVAMCDFNIGILHQSGGHYSSALASQQRARAQFQEQNQALEVAKCNADMADVYRMLNLRTEALEAYNSAISVFTEIPLDYERARAELGRASVLAAQGHSLEAGEALTHAEAVFRQQRNNLQLANARLLQAYWLSEAGDLQAARAEARRAEDAFARLHMPARAAEARFVDASIGLESGENVLRRMSGVCRVARAYSQGWLESRAEQAIGRHYAGKNQVSAALKHLRASIEALEASRTLVPGEELHTAFISNKLSVYEDIVAVLVARGRDRDLSDALEYVERSKSRLLLERVQQSISESLSQATGDVPGGPPSFARLSELRSQLNRMYNQIHPGDGDASKRLLDSPREHLERLQAVENAYRTALREAEVDSGPGLLSLLRVASPTQLRSWLTDAETLIEYYVLHGTVCAFILSNSTRVRVTLNLATVEEIEHSLRRLRYHLKRAGSAPGYVESHSSQFLTGVQLPLSTLYKLLIQPLVPYIAGEHITIVPHGILHGLPFHALYDSERQEYALDRWEISYSPSATVRYLDNMYEQRSKPTSEPLDALVMGVPDAGLEQIQVEVEELGVVLPTAMVYCGPTATLEKFREFAGRSRLIHLATHAVFRADNPLFSGLKFSDGWLLARDLYSMRLNCDLVTLSACRTGQAQVESGDEMFGLLRGFLAAGAHSVAVSLWPAEDLPTASLMTRFHAMMAQGQSRTAALRLAQKFVRQTWQHPYQWAAFALFGER